jgi:hypothetical protein
VRAPEKAARAQTKPLFGRGAEQAGHGIAVNALKPVTAIETPGMYYGRSGAGSSAAGQYPGPERYVESAVLLALQTPQTCTGRSSTTSRPSSNWLGRGHRVLRSIRSQHTGVSLRLPE